MCRFWDPVSLPCGFSCADEEGRVHTTRGPAHVAVATDAS